MSTRTSEKRTFVHPRPEAAVRGRESGHNDNVPATALWYQRGMIPGEAYETLSNGGGSTDGCECEHRTAAGRLERAFARHLARDRHADCARVVVRDGDDGRYEYVDGVHYVTDVDRGARERVEAFVDRRGLDVVMDGLSGFAFRHETPVPAADAHVAGAVVDAAFDASFTDLTDVVEVLDATTEVSWTDGDRQHA